MHNIRKLTIQRFRSLKMNQTNKQGEKRLKCKDTGLYFDASASHCSVSENLHSLNF